VESYKEHISCLEIEKEIFTAKEIKNIIRSLKPEIDPSTLSFFTTLYLLEKYKEDKMLIFSEKPTMENFINPTKKYKLIYKLIKQDKGKAIVAQKIKENKFTKRFSKTIFSKNKPLKEVILTTFVFFNQLPYYTKNTKKLSKNAKKLLTLFSEKSKPLETITYNLPKSFGIDPDSFSEKQYKNFEKRFIEVSRELKYKEKNLKEKLKTTFQKNVGSPEKIKEETSQIKELDNKIFAIHEALNKDNWIDLVSIILVDKTPQFFEDETVNKFELETKKLSEKIKQLQVLNLEKLQSSKKKPVRISLHIPNVIKIDEIFYMEKKNNQKPNPEFIDSMSTQEKINLIINVIKSLQKEKQNG